MHTNKDLTDSLFSLQQILKRMNAQARQYDEELERLFEEISLYAIENAHILSEIVELKHKIFTINHP